MKKLEKLIKKVDALQSKINNVSFERKDTSYRRAGGYFGTSHANIDGLIVVSSFARTKHLNTYVCVNQDESKLLRELKQAQFELKTERERLQYIAAKKWAENSIKEAEIFTENQIKDGTILTNYAKIFIEGNKNIYACHPYYKHSDYNKWRAMPNTAKHRRAAEIFNQKMFAAGLTI